MIQHVSRSWNPRKPNIEGGLAAALIVIEGAAVELAPKDSGRLAGSITFKTRSQQSATQSPATKQDTITGSVGTLEGFVGTNVEYALFQEFGTSKMAPQPFITLAAEQEKQRAYKAYQAVISRSFK